MELFHGNSLLDYNLSKYGEIQKILNKKNSMDELKASSIKNMEKKPSLIERFL